MQDPVINQEVQLDLSKVAALQQKRTLAFLNHFVSTTTLFLNNFLKQCEQKLMHFERKLEKVDAALVLLEARLASIPEVNTSEATLHLKPDNIALEEQNIEAESNNTENSNFNINESTKDSEFNPEYERFVKMVQVGVPIEAVKLKISLEGLEPNVLEKIIKK